LKANFVRNFIGIVELKVELKKYIRILLAFVLVITGCSNVFESAARKNTDEAYYEEARKAINNFDYDLAITNFEKMGPSFLATTVVREAYAGALAGKCGLNFLDYVEALSGASLSGSTIFIYAMSAWDGVNVSPVHCLRAEQQIKAIWAVETATATQKFFMAILGLAKMGAYLRSKADVDGASNLGNGVTDSTFDACLATPGGPNNLTDDEVGEVLTGLMLFLTNITDFAASLSSDVSGSTSGITAACASMADPPLSLPANQIICNYTDWANVTPADKAAVVAIVRDMLATGATTTDAAARFGLGSPVSAGNVGFEVDGSCSLNPFVLCCP